MPNYIRTAAPDASLEAVANDLARYLKEHAGAWSPLMHPADARTAADKLLRHLREHCGWSDTRMTAAELASLRAERDRMKVELDALRSNLERLLRTPDGVGQLLEGQSNAVRTLREVAEMVAPWAEDDGDD